MHAWAGCKCPECGKTRDKNRDWIQSPTPSATDNGKTTLRDAIRQGSMEIVKDLVEHGADVNATDADGETPMDYAICWCKTEIAQYLVDHGADVNHKDQKGRPLLMRACSPFGHPPSLAIVKCLVMNGANMNAKYKGQTALDAAIENKNTNWGSEEVVAYLQSGGGKQTGLISREEQTRREESKERAKEQAREDGSIGLVKKLIRRSGGAREFVDLALQSGFVVESEDALGLCMVGHDCRLILGVLASRGPDSIWNLQHKGGGKPVVALVCEGRRTF